MGNYKKMMIMILANKKYNPFIMMAWMLFFNVIAHTKAFAVDNDAINTEVLKADGVFRMSGMEGLVDTSQKCYDSFKNMSCIYFDVAAKWIESTITAGAPEKINLDAQTNAYFDISNISLRISSFLTTRPDLSDEDLQQEISDIINSVDNNFVNLIESKSITNK